MQVIAEEWRFDVLAEFARGLVSAERNDADAVTFGTLPLAVEPRTRHHEIRVLRIVLFRVTENLPRAPRIFLIPESRDVQIRHGRGVKLVDPRFFLPEFVVVRMIDARIPVRNRAVQIFRVDVRERAEIEIPLVGVVGFEIEVRVLVLVGLLHDRVFEVVALAQRAEAVVVVVHPLVDGRGLLADGLERGMRMQQGERGRQAIVGDAEHSDLPVVVGNVFHQPLDRVVGVGGLVGGLGIFQIDPGREVEHALGLEAPAQILDDEDVAVLREFLEGGRDLLGRLLGNTVGRAAKQNRAADLSGRRE